MDSSACVKSVDQLNYFEEPGSPSVCLESLDHCGVW